MIEKKKKHKVLDIHDIENESFILKRRSYLVEKVIMFLTAFHNCLLISIKLHILNCFKMKEWLITALNSFQYFLRS